MPNPLVLYTPKFVISLSSQTLLASAAPTSSLLQQVVYVCLAICSGVVLRAFSSLVLSMSPLPVPSFLTLFRREKGVLACGGSNYRLFDRAGVV